MLVNFTKKLQEQKGSEQVYPGKVHEQGPDVEHQMGEGPVVELLPVDLDVLHL